MFLLPAARHLVRRRPDLVGTQSLEQRATPVENPLVRTEELVARTDEKVAIDGADIDQAVRPVVNRINPQPGARGVGRARYRREIGNATHHI